MPRRRISLTSESKVYSGRPAEPVNPWKTTRVRVWLAILVIAIVSAGTWAGIRWSRISKRNAFVPIAEAFLARLEARDVPTLARLMLDSTGMADALKLPTQQVKALRGSLVVVSGQVESDYALIVFDSKASFCPGKRSLTGRFEIRFVRQGGRWQVERADPSMC